MNLMCDYKIKKDALGNCLSTTIRTNGAVAIFLPGVAERIGQLMGCGFYMVFTSIHEVMIHSERNANPKELKQVLKILRGKQLRRMISLLIRFIYESGVRIVQLLLKQMKRCQIAECCI